MEASGDVDEVAAEVKMSKSKPQTAIFVTDSDEEIEAKIRRAYCPARVVEMNPVLEITRYILFARPGFKLVVERPEKYGGTVIYESYSELERDYIEGRLHPADLKAAVAREVKEIIRPIRERLLSDPELRDALKKIESAVTR